MIETTKEEQPRSLLRSFLIMMCLVFTVALTGFFGLYSSASNESLVVSCVDEKGFLEPSLACIYLKQVRDPGPNESVTSASSQPQTIFGFFLSGHEASNPRSDELLEHFIRKNVQWDKKHSNVFSPLHLAILDHNESLVKRFLRAGASPQKTIDATGKLFHGMNALDFAGLLKTKVIPGNAGSTDAKLAQIEKVLIAAGAKATPIPEPVPTPDPGLTPDGGPTSDSGPTPERTPQK